MSTYTISFKNSFIFHHTFFIGGESSGSLDTKNYIENKWPELKNLNATPDEKMARASALAQLTEMVKDPKKSFGSIESTLNAVDTNATTRKIEEIIQALKTQSFNSDFWKTFDRVSFNGWDADGSANFSLLRGTNKTNRMFLTQILRNNTQLSARIFSPQVPGEVLSEDPVKFSQIQSLQRFLLAYEQHEPTFDKRILRLANEELLHGRLDKAEIILREPLKNKSNLNIDNLLTSQGVNNALRTIKDTASAGDGMVDDMKQSLNESGLTPEQLALSQKIVEVQKDPNFISQKRKQGEDLYKRTLLAIPDGDPQRITVLNNREKMIQGFADHVLFMTVMTDYISHNGSKGLGDTADAFNDMKGLYGTFNWSDEHVQMGKEALIMLASFVLTAGMGTLLEGLAGAARLAEVASAARNAKNLDAAVRLASEGKTVRATLATGNAKIAAGVRNAAQGIGKVAEVGIRVDKLASSQKLANTGYEALKFTTASAALKSIFRADGEHSGFDGFFTDLAKNTVMFTAFGGMEKYVSAPMKAKLIEKFGIQNTTAKFVIGTTVLSAWDIAVMQGLHMAETGKIEGDWMSVYEALAFRVGMKGGRNLKELNKMFPNLSQKFSDWKIKNGNTLNKKTQTGESSSQRNSSDMAHGAPLEPLNDKNHIVINSQKPIVPDALSPVEARKQDIRSRARDNKNVLTDLAQKEKEIAEKIKLQALDSAIAKTRAAVDVDKATLRDLQNNGIADTGSVIRKIEAGENLIKSLEAQKAQLNSQKPIVPDALSPVEARKQDIRSRARDNKNVLTDLAQKEKEIAEKIKLQAPDLAAVIEKGDPKKTTEALADKKNWKKWAALGIIVLALLALSQCHQEKAIKKGETPDDAKKRFPQPTQDDASTYEATQKYCKDANDKASTLDSHRESLPGVILNSKRRESISDRWSRGPEWTAVVALWDKNRSIIPQSAQKAMYAVLHDHNPEHIRALQQQIGMGEYDNKTAQDGILGPITTKAIRDYIETCSSVPTKSDNSDETNSIIDNDLIKNAPVEQGDQSTNS